MKSFSTMNYIIIIIIFIFLGVLYKSFENKRISLENKDNNEQIQKYLLDDVTLAKSKKPILWIHVPYEYNSRNWLSFGSRSSLDLNQPYLYLTVKSIISKCDNSFTICIIYDSSFEKLITGWNINMTKITNPILDNMRKLGLIKLLYKYGGLLCPISFLCMKDLIGLYTKGINNNKMFLCETNNHNITTTSYQFYPSLSFCGSQKENQMIQILIDFIQRNMSNDFTAASHFLGDFDRFCEKKIKNNEINMIDGIEIGIKTDQEDPILLEDLMSQQYLKLYPETYGILIPSDQILKRTKYEWFAKLSAPQILESNTIIGNYLLLANTPDSKNDVNILKPYKENKKWVGFWKTPLVNGLYGLKPNMLGDNMIKQSYTGQ